MIRTLTIHNIALIEQIKVEFHKGLNVLSGETGAGKSIIIDAVALVLGGRADRDLIRTGCERASVEAEFTAEDADGLKEVLEREQIEWDGENLIVFRDLSQSGRNVCRINGVVVTVSVMKEITGFLLNLHGQSEHQFLADEEKHLSYLDMMGGPEHRAMLQDTAQAYTDFIVNHRAYAKLVKMNEDRERRIDILRQRDGGFFKVAAALLELLFEFFTKGESIRNASGKPDDYLAVIKTAYFFRGGFKNGMFSHGHLSVSGNSYFIAFFDGTDGCTPERTGHIIFLLSGFVWT